MYVKKDTLYSNLVLSSIFDLTTIVTAGVFSREQFSATSLFKLIFTLVSLSIIKIPSLGNIELVKQFDYIR